MKTRRIGSLSCLLYLVAACGPEGELPTGLSVESWQEPLVAPASSGPGAIVADEQCNAQELPPGDDDSSAAVALPFELSFYGGRYAQAYVNTNGSLTFERPEGYTIPFRLDTVTQPVIAPFFADVDTRGDGAGRVRYGTTTFQGRPAFCVNWLDVGYYREHADKLNRFQLLLVDRGDTGAGNFDIVMNYGRVVWDSGDADGGSGGVGGSFTAAGFSAGSSAPESLNLLAGSHVPGAFLDGEQATGLIWSSRGSTLPGRYVFAIRSSVLPRPPPVASGWSSTGRLETERAKAQHHAVRLFDGRVLAVGGFNPYTDLYDPATGTWAATGSTRASRRQHTTTLLMDGRVLVVGGLEGKRSISTELYDPATGTWRRGKAMRDARRFHSAVRLGDGRVLVAGGAGPSGRMLASAEVYDPATGQWTPTGSLGTARCEHTAVVLGNGQVLVVGGIDDSKQPLASAEVYDPATGAWTAVGSLAVARKGHTAARLLTGEVLVAGGVGDVAQSASAELYDPSTGGWRTVGSLLQPRFHHTATLLRSGRVLVVGGYNPSTGVHASAELYDPETGLWRSAGSMQNDRYHHSATLLSDGRVLVVGGFSNGDQGSAEVYTP